MTIVLAMRFGYTYSNCIQLFYAIKKITIDFSIGSNL